MNNMYYKEETDTNEEVTTEENVTEESNVINEEEAKNSDTDNETVDEIDNEIDMIAEEDNEDDNEEEDKKRWHFGKPVDLSANCSLEMHINPENKMIYVCPGKAQYFIASSSKCCGPIRVKYLSHNCNRRCKKICGCLGTYFVFNSGIVIIPKKRLRPGAIDVLPFLAYDGCNYYKFEAIFTYSPCECCKCCKGSRR